MTMTTDQVALGTAFNRCFETLEAGEHVFAHDALSDLLPPFWRFQLRGPEAFSAHLHSLAGDSAISTRLLRFVPTVSGFVLEHEETAGDEVARRLWLCEVRDGQITETLGYCNGGWDAELRARHAVEAPMVRP
jgi:hypothetical protein